MFSDIPASQIAIVLISMLISIPLHEAMHGFVAHLLGDTTAQEQGRLTLNPLSHIDIVTTVLLPVFLIALHLPPIFIAKPVPFNPNRLKYDEFGAALVGLAGPVSNLVLAVLSSLVIRFAGTSLSIGMLQALVIFTQINIALFVFNMIPLPPLDGSRLVYAFAPEPLRRLMQQIEAAGLMVVVFVFLLLSPVLSPIIGNISRAIFTFLLR